jgi:hypothetical protein
MPARTLVPAAIVTAPTPERQQFVQNSYPHDQHPRQSGAGPSRVTYGSVQNTSPGSHKGKEPAVEFDDHEMRYEAESCHSNDSDAESLVDSE